MESVWFQPVQHRQYLLEDYFAVIYRHLGQILKDLHLKNGGPGGIWTRDLPHSGFAFNLPSGRFSSSLLSGRLLIPVWSTGPLYRLYLSCFVLLKILVIKLVFTFLDRNCTPQITSASFIDGSTSFLEEQAAEFRRYLSPLHHSG